MATKKKMRGVICFDLEIQAQNLKHLASIEEELKALAQAWITNQDKDEIKVIAHQAEMTDRRGGVSGPIANMVWRKSNTNPYRRRA